MRRNPIFLICLGISIITLWTNTARTVPPEPKIPEDALKRPLIPIYRNQVAERIKWWKDMFVNARKSKEIIEARKGLISDYKRYNSSRYKSYFVRDSVKTFKNLLSGQGYNANDMLIRDKEINIAIAFSEMAQKNAKPALDLMITSKNKGLRYLGWKGYENISEQLIKGGPRTATDFAKTLDDAMQTETSPAILRKIFQVMETFCKAQSVSTSVLRSVKSKILLAFETAWGGWRAKVQAGTDAEMIETIGEAVRAMVEVAMSKPSDLKATDRTKILQMILNQAYSASMIYDKTLQVGKNKFNQITNEKIRNRKIAENLKLQHTCSQLLLSCEDGLGKISGNKQTPIQQALNAQVARGAAVRGSVLTWASDLKQQGVKDPVEKPKKPISTE